jgi:hypothetical protein
MADETIETRGHYLYRLVTESFTTKGDVLEKYQLVFSIARPVRNLWIMQYFFYNQTLGDIDDSRFTLHIIKDRGVKIPDIYQVASGRGNLATWWTPADKRVDWGNIISDGPNSAVLNAIEDGNLVRISLEIRSGGLRQFAFMLNKAMPHQQKLDKLDGVVYRLNGRSRTSLQADPWAVPGDMAPYVATKRGTGWRWR